MKLLKLTLYTCLGLLLVTTVVGCGKKVDPNYKAALDHAKEMNKEEYRSVRTFDMQGADDGGMIILGVKSMTARQPTDPAPAPKTPTTGMDVANTLVKEAGKAVPVVGKVWLGVKALDTAEALAEDNVHIVEQPPPVTQPPPIIVQPEPPVIVEPPVVIVDPPPVVIVDPPDPIIVDPSYPPDTGVNSGDPLP